MGEAHVMKELQYRLLDELPCEEKEEKLKQIVILYSNYMEESYALREAIADKIAKIIGSNGTV